MANRRARKPRHVPAELVYEFDMFLDEEYQRNPFKRVKELTEQAPPIFWTPCNGGHWVTQGYDATFEIGSTPKVFSNEVVPHSWMNAIAKIQKFLANIGIKTPRIPMPFPLLVDPPLHSQYRRPLTSVFSPKNIRQLEAGFRQSAQGLLDAIADQGQCEFISTVAEPLPVQLFLQIFGLPLENLPEYRALLKEHMQGTTEVTSNLAKLTTLLGIVDVLRDTLIDRKNNPKDDLISKLWQTEINGKPIELHDIENLAVTLFLGGLDTVVQGIGFGVHHLAVDQELQQQLRDNPDRIDDAIDEILRRYAIATPPRRALTSTELHGVNFKKNDVIYMFLHGANLDPAKFENPEKVDIDRPNKKEHISFNSGPHYCLGAYLAKVELRILYEELLKKIPTFRLDPDKPPKFHAGFIVGIDSLNLVW